MLEEGREIESKNEKGDGFVFPGQKINLSLFLLTGIRKANLLVY